MEEFNSAVRLLDRAASLWPDNEALDDGSLQYTYKEYKDAALKVGYGILSSGAERNAPAVVFLPKGAPVLISFMGAMYAGCPYAPVAANSPSARLARIIESLNPGVIITSAELAEKLPSCRAKVLVYEDLVSASVPSEGLDMISCAISSVKPDDPIYIIYTSGSTGNPKGVTQTHRGVVRYAMWLKETFGYNEKTIMANQAPFYFDNSVLDIYGSLYCGGKLCITPEVLFMFPGKLPEYLKDNSVTSILWVPTVMINVANSGVLGQVELPALKNVCFAGEVMPNTQLNIWRKALPSCTYANLYGPTETDVCCFYIADRAFENSEPLPIGRACEMFEYVKVLREDGSECDIGEEGEIVACGDGVALGYWNNPELTEKSFFKDGGRRCYRTGDLAVRNSEGLLMFCGRRDNQIKVKGNRIELGEIENAAMCIDGVENVCAVFDAEKEEIVLFLETKKEFTLRRFNAELKKYILSYMLPSRLFCMEKLPHTANDKIDRVKLKGMI